MEDATASYQLDLVTGALAWNDALYRVYGYDRAEQANSIDWWTVHIHPDDAMILNQAMDKLLDPMISGWKVSYRLRKSDNSYVWVEDQAVVGRGPTGSALTLSGSLRPESPGQS